MFLSAEPKNIEDFLQSLSFIPPTNPKTGQPFDIKYFVLPIQGFENKNPMDQSLFAAEFPNQIGEYTRARGNLQPPPGGGPGAITYTKKQLNQTHSFGDSNFDMASQPNPMPKNPTKPEMLTSSLQIYGGEIESNQKLNRIGPNLNLQNAGNGKSRFNIDSFYRPQLSMVENTPRSMTLQLKENYNVFPKNTIFYLEKPCEKIVRVIRKPGKREAK
jgi:hypothetical protein